METRANFVLIGLFTLATIAAAFGFVFWFQHVGSSGDRTAYRVIFNGPVSGLRTGASVMFNGIRVGEVASLGLDDPTKVVALVSIDRTAPIRQDTRVGLEFQGLTGIASVSLKGGSVSAPPLKAPPGEIPTLIADADAIQDVTETARATLQNMNRVIEENQEALRNTLRNIDAFTTTLARNSERIDSILAGVENLTGGKNGKGELVETAESIRELANNLDRRTAEISAGLARFSNTGLRNVEALVSDGRRTLADIDRAVRNFDRNPQRLIFGGSGQSVPEYRGRR